MKIPDQVEAIDFSSPRGAGMSMTAWNAIGWYPFHEVNADTDRLKQNEIRHIFLQKQRSILHLDRFGVVLLLIRHLIATLDSN